MPDLPELPVIDDLTPIDAVVDGELKGRGHDPSQVVKEMFEPPTQLVLIPRSEYSERIRERKAAKATIRDILLQQNIPSLDQGPNGYCWGHSTVGCVQAVRAINNQPYVPLSAYMVCAIIKRGRNEGGWCGLSAKFLREVGVCSQEIWPQGNRNTKLDTPEARADAARNKVTEDWVDLSRDVYDQNLTFDQVATCLISNVPCALDFNWWSHSVMGTGLHESNVSEFRTESGKLAMYYDAPVFDRLMFNCGYGDSVFGPEIRNSWGDSYGERGFANLKGNRGIPDGALAIRVVGAA